MNLPDLWHELLFPSDHTLGIFNVIFVILVLVAAATATLFTVIYWYFYPWRKNRSGRSVMHLVSGLAAVLWIIVLARALGDYPGRIVVTLVVYLVIPINLIRILVALLAKWSHGRGNAEERRDAVARDFEQTIPKRTYR